MTSLVEKESVYPKQAFDSSLAPKSFIVPVQSSASEDILSAAPRIIELLNTFGVVVVQFEKEESALEQLVCFKEIFGNTMMRDRSDSDGIAEVTITDESSPYPGASSREYSFHTDGTYDEDPPNIVALRCQISAQEGGITQIASGKKIYKKLSSIDRVALEALHRNDALSISRAGKNFMGGVFKRTGDRIAIRYRTDEAAHYSDDADVQRGIELIQNFLSDEKNWVSFKLESQQVLITDNLTVLHTRTAFVFGDPRLMHRLWFNGAPKGNGSLFFGFTVGD
jgi:alpha-ketoglutarate-dependent taurine dioxygenase